MTSLHLVIYSYVFVILLFYLFICLFIFNFFYSEYQKELFYLTYLGSVLINLCLAFIWIRFGIPLNRKMRKKSERRVSHM